MSLFFKISEHTILKPIFWIDDHFELSQPVRVVLFIPVIPVFVLGIAYVVITNPVET
jgi:hypothetical protein